jgi:hypothetical protein
MGAQASGFDITMSENMKKMLEKFAILLNCYFE